MMKKIYLFLSLLLSLSVGAQNRLLTIEDAILKRGTTLAPQTLPGLAWVPGTNAVTWRVADETKGDYLTVFDYKTNTTTHTVTVEDLNQALAGFRVRFAAPGQNLPDYTKFPTDISWQSARTILIRDKGAYFIYDIVDKTIQQENQLPAGAQNADRHAATAHIAYTMGNNLFIKSRSGSPIAVTNDANKGIVNGQAVHRNEFGINKGTFWNSTGYKLAFYKMDETMVTECSYYGYGAYPGANTTFKYPMAGQASHQVKLGVYDAAKQTTVYMQTNQPLEQYLTNITWSPDDKFIYIACVMREQDLMYLKRFNAETGELEKILFEESNKRYVEPEHGPLFLNGSKNKFIWQSERDGYNHLYLYNTDGELLKQLTKGDWVVTEVLGMDAKGENVYFTATKKSPLDNTLYKVEIKSGTITELSGDEGRHFVQFNSTYTAFIDNHTSYKVPRQITIKNAATGKKEHELLTAPNPLKDYQLGDASVFTLKSTDGTTDLYARMIKPINFDPTKKYPVAVYVYGGPHLQLINNGYLNNADLWMQYMAQNGFVVFSLDNRGSANRGFEFESAVHRQLGKLEVADQLTGVNFLKKQSFVDTNRMAVFGWSFGGFMTTTLMLKAPGTFKVGIAGGPVIDWKMYEIMYTERYMDAPIENPDGYDNNNLLNYVQNLQGKLLMIHGTSDDVVVWQHSLEFVNAAVKKGKQMDYFVYPGHAHNVLGKDRVHLYQKVTDYIMDNIGK